MQDQRLVTAWKSWMALAVILAFVSIAVGQVPRQGRAGRGQVRNQGGVPLKKARPEAGDPLAKVAGSTCAARTGDVPLYITPPFV